MGDRTEFQQREVKEWLALPSTTQSVTDYLEKHCPDIRSATIESDGIVAGGAVADAIIHLWRVHKNLAQGEPPPPKDFDIFTAKASKASRGAKIAEKANYEGTEKRVVRLLRSHEVGKKQFVFVDTEPKKSPTPEELSDLLLGEFDINACRASWIPGAQPQLRATDGFIQAVATNTARMEIICANSLVRLAEKALRLDLATNPATVVAETAMTFRSRTFYTKVYGGTVKKLTPQLHDAMGHQAYFVKLGHETHLRTRCKGYFYSGDWSKDPEILANQLKTNATVPFKFKIRTNGGIDEQILSLQAPVKLLAVSARSKTIRGQPTLTLEGLYAEEPRYRITGWHEVAACGRLGESLRLEPDTERLWKALQKPNTIPIYGIAAPDTHTPLMLAARTHQLTEIREKLHDNPELISALQSPAVILCAVKGASLDEIGDILQPEHLTAPIGITTSLQEIIDSDLVENLPDRLVDPEVISETRTFLNHSLQNVVAPAALHSFLPDALKNSGGSTHPAIIGGIAHLLFDSIDNQHPPHPKLVTADTLNKVSCNGLSPLEEVHSLLKAIKNCYKGAANTHPQAVLSDLAQWLINRIPPAAISNRLDIAKDLVAMATANNKRSAGLSALWLANVVTASIQTRSVALALAA